MSMWFRCLVEVFATDFMLYACVAVPIKIGAGILSHLALDSLVAVIIPSSELGARSEEFVRMDLHLRLWPFVECAC